MLISLLIAVLVIGLVIYTVCWRKGEIPAPPLQNNKIAGRRGRCAMTKWSEVDLE